MLYSKNGSLPKPQTDGTDGWIEVEDPPVAGDGEEVVWWYPPGWVVRPVKPVKKGSVFDWSQSQQCWTETLVVDVITVPNVTQPVVTLDNNVIIDNIINDTIAGGYNDNIINDTIAGGEHA